MLVRIAAPPAEGAANLALVDLLSAALGIRRRDVTIVSGETARTKRLHIAGDKAALVARLEAVVPR